MKVSVTCMFHYLGTLFVVSFTTILVPDLPTIIQDVFKYLYSPLIPGFILLVLFVSTPLPCLRLCSNTRKYRIDMSLRGKRTNDRGERDRCTKIVSESGMDPYILRRGPVNFDLNYPSHTQTPICIIVHFELSTVTSPPQRPVQKTVCFLRFYVTFSYCVFVSVFNTILFPVLTATVSLPQRDPSRLDLQVDVGTEGSRKRFGESR